MVAIWNDFNDRRIKLSMRIWLDWRAKKGYWAKVPKFVAVAAMILLDMPQYRNILSGTGKYDPNSEPTQNQTDEEQKGDGNEHVA